MLITNIPLPKPQPRPQFPAGAQPQPKPFQNDQLPQRNGVQPQL
jgi:hypothetical protein